MSLENPLENLGLERIRMEEDDCYSWVYYAGKVESIINKMQQRIEELENENKELKDENAWHRCDIPNEDGLYNFPPEPGNYLVEFVSDYPESKESPFVTESEFDPNYNDWDPTPFGNHARQWREMVKAPEVSKCRPQESSEAK